MYVSVNAMCKVIYIEHLYYHTMIYYYTDQYISSLTEVLSTRSGLNTDEK